MNPPPSVEEAQLLFARCRSNGKLTHQGLAFLPSADQRVLIHYLTAHRMPVYTALIDKDYHQQNRLRLLGYAPGHVLSTGLKVWTCPVHESVPSGQPLPA